MKIGGVTNFDLLITTVKSKNIFLAPPSGQNRKLKFPNTWILDKPEVTKWPEMKPEVFYRPNLSRNFLEWVTKTIMSHIIWLMIMVEFCLWPINLWIGFLSSGSRYSKTDFRIVFLMSSLISESYWLFAEMIDHMIGRWLLPVCLKSSQRHMYARNGSTWIPKWPLLSSEFISDLI